MTTHIKILACILTNTHLAYIAYIKTIKNEHIIKILKQSASKNGAYPLV